MKALFNILKNKWTVHFIGLSALCTLIWLAGPMIVIAERTPLASPWIRGGVLLLVINLFLLWRLLVQARSKKKDQQLMDELASPPQDPEREAIDEATDNELMELQNKFDHAMQLLKSSSSYGQRSRKYLYELPWYVIIGAPGSGKTTLLSNSGLKFPLDDHMDGATIQGVGGTRNCSWMFAENAVFLDTAGRYVTQDSHQPVDASAWQNFLKLIKQYRKQRPINGVLVSLSIADVMQWSDSQLMEYAQTVRKRTSELHRRLGVQFPIYLLITKCDLVAGFTEFFADFGRNERRQVWGETFTDPRPGQTQENITLYEERFDALVGRLRQHIPKKFQSENDLQRRGLILDFPEQLASLKPSVVQFLRQAFSGSRYDAAHYFLRGVYFTSGTQEGTPIDRVMGNLASAYGFDRHRQPVFSGRGKSYFIHRLLTQVLFPESELAGLDLRVVHRRRWIRGVVCAGIVGLVGAMTALWSFSYIRNERTIGEVREHVDQYQLISQSPRSESQDERNMLKRINTIHSAQRLFAERSWWDGYGLYQGEKLQSGIDALYTELLLSDLLPATRKRLENRIGFLLKADPKGELGLLYDVLKTYLLLGIPEKMDRNKAFAKRILHTEWRTEFDREPDFHTALTSHLDNLFEKSITPQNLDQTLVQRARRRLNAVPIAVRIYTHLKSDALADSAHDIFFEKILGVQGRGIFTANKRPSIEGLRIPGLFTQKGYKTYFEQQGLAVIEKALEQNWVLENPEVIQSQKTERLYDDLEKLYFAEYQARWQHALSNIRLVRPRSPNHTIQIIKQLTGAETPLRLLLECVAQNTRFAPPPPPVSTENQTGQEKEKNIFSPADLKAQLETAAGKIPKPARKVASRFRPLNAMVMKKGDTPAPLDQVIANLNQLHDFIMQNIDTKALSVVKEQMNSAGATSIPSQIKIEFKRLPEPLKGWLLPMIDSSWRMTLNSAKSELKTLWQTEVLSPYRASLNQRYPLYKSSSSDATLTDFSNFFGPSGILDQFFTNYLADIIDTSQSPWRVKAKGSAALNLTPEVLSQLQYAHQIKKNFFNANGSTPSIQFHLKPLYLDASVLWSRINLEGQTMQYAHGPVQTQTFQWPGPQPQLGVRISFKPLNGNPIGLHEEGPWAWLRALDSAEVKTTAVPHRYHVTFKAGGAAIRYELSAASVFNPLKSRAHNLFRCPESL